MGWLVRPRYLRHPSIRDHSRRLSEPSLPVALICCYGLVCSKLGVRTESKHIEPSSGGVIRVTQIWLAVLYYLLIANGRYFGAFSSPVIWPVKGPSPGSTNCRVRTFKVCAVNAHPTCRSFAALTSGPVPD